MNQVLRTIGKEHSNVHVGSANLMQTIKSHGWEQALKLFRPRVGEDDDQQDAEIVKTRTLQLPSLDAQVLILLIFTGTEAKGHWSILIRDARGVGIAMARWRYFDTADNGTTAERIKRIVMDCKELWKNGMVWETVMTPQQDLERLDCGALGCTLAISYVRWSEKLNHECLNSNNIKVTLKGDNVQWGQRARQLVQDSAKKEKLPQQHAALRSIRFKMDKPATVKETATTGRARATDYF